MRQHKITILLCFFPLLLCAQLPGKLLVVGGGSENYNSWSDAPYGWAVQQAPNKRVAIIGTETNPTSWLPTYFVARGAVFAKNFPVATQAAANTQALHDSLVTYDMIFFRGGNQANYYNRYRNTLLQQAVETVFNRGGVVGGTSAGLHILSKVMYTAVNGSVYPEEALANPHNQYMTLSDNFFSFLPGVVFDSHVAERGRFGRTLGFVAKWKFDQNQDILGIGVDDKTALCIDQNLVGTVYGTGAVSIYRSGENNQFSLGGTKLLASNVLVSQMIHGCSFHLSSLEMNGLTQLIPPRTDGSLPASHILLSATEALNKNQQMLGILGQNGNPADTIVVVTTSTENNVSAYVNWLNTNGKPTAILIASASNGNSSSWQAKIGRSNKFLFAASTYEPLMDFMATPVGLALRGKLFSFGTTVAFVGGNSRFAGRSLMLNYDQTYASYDGLMDFRPGIGLLRSAIVMPNTFAGSPASDVENTATGVPYGMVRDSLQYGIWLHDDAVAHFRPNGAQFELTSYGNFPLILIENRGTPAARTNQSAVSSGLPRGVAGFNKFYLMLMDQSVSRIIDTYSSLADSKIRPIIRITPNPSSNYIRLEGLDAGLYRLRIFSASGLLVQSLEASPGQTIDISTFKKGMYIVSLESDQGKMSVTKFVKQ
ncbi:MAG TPA: T9SS type A sorting domain-containing protein [Bacteroidales bacterium]|nr:T9SS type A sorting domain-containing protein [Bacteroidales bacterium]